MTANCAEVSVGVYCPPARSSILLDVMASVVVPTVSPRTVTVQSTMFVVPEAPLRSTAWNHALPAGIVLFNLMDAHDGYVTPVILPTEGLLKATVMLYPEIPLVAVSCIIVYVVVQPTETVEVPGWNERVGDADGVGVGVGVDVVVGTVVGTVVMVVVGTDVGIVVGTVVGVGPERTVM